MILHAHNVHMYKLEEDVHNTHKVYFNLFYALFSENFLQILAEGSKGLRYNPCDKAAVIKGTDHKVK